MATLSIKRVIHGDWLDIPLDSLYHQISTFCEVDEHELIRELHFLAYQESEQDNIKRKAELIVDQVREAHDTFFFDIEALLQEYSLSDEDGVTLMCLAEALLRIPDSSTRDNLIADKLSGKEWERHFSKDNTLFVNASTWGLMLAGNLVSVGDGSILNLFKRSTKPIIRSAVDKAMRIMGQHFVLGRTIKEAMKNARPYLKKGYIYSYDMLGESAITDTDAERYYKSYASAIINIAENSKNKNRRPSLSIKLSALHPRFDEKHRNKSLQDIINIVQNLVCLGIEHDVGITIDAEESDRMELTLSIFEAIYSKQALRGWEKFGLVVQAYSKRALPALCWLTRLAKNYGDEIPVRLVKGAYWDTEIKHSQVLGHCGYPVYTRKEYTDVAYLACARYLLSEVTRGAIYPQFASHNAHTVSSIQVIAPGDRPFEFQRLHGMGNSLYDSVLKTTKHQEIRIYAPVGSHEDLLPYLVRRLLENGANSSFVHQLSDEDMNIESLTQWPLKLENIGPEFCSRPIPLPINLFSDRKNSLGVNLATKNTRELFMHSVEKFNHSLWRACPIVNGEYIKGTENIDVFSPYDRKEKVGDYQMADKTIAENALSAADQGQIIWRNTRIEDRCEIIETLAEKLEENNSELIALCQREAGKTIQDAIDEVREAIDFCRYYSQIARKHFSEPVILPGPTGESNQLWLEPKGIFVCISPWNFPLAIFLGQVTAALLAGNTVIAKPAETTTLIAYKAVELLFEAGLPVGALQFLPGSGRELGAVLNSDARVSGVVFTGSNNTARVINQTLCARDADTPIATLIAETGGLNAMIVDSTALPEQVTRDVIDSAFSSAGQRCSALRVLYVQEDIAERVITLIKGAMEKLVISNPQLLSTDIGPVIDEQAQNKLLSYIEDAKATSASYFQVALDDTTKKGTFVAPTLFEIDSILSLKEEQFGPILHVVRYAAGDLEKIIDDINSKRYGLTLGVHSRNTSTYEKVATLANVGNVYINRNQVGAVVGVNPFGGRGLSGTGPKAGGPNYLLRFATEKTITNNVAAIGGNIELLNASSV